MERLQLPKALEEHLTASLTDLADDITTDWNCFYTPEVEDIEHEAFSGFIPWTNGGYRIRAMSDLGTCHGSGRIPEAVEKYIESSIKDAMRDFKEQYGKDYEYDQLTEQEQEDYWEIEDMYLREGAEFWYEVRVQFYASDNYRNDSGEDEVLFMGGVNTDFTYGRDKGLQTNYSETFKVSELTTEKITEILSDIRARIGQ